MTFKNVNIKALAVILLASCVVAVGAIFVNTSQCFAKQVITDWKAKATINDDGVSGTIELDDGFMFVTRSDNNSVKLGKALTCIAGIDLKHIVKFNDGGYVDKFWLTHEFACCYPTKSGINFVYSTLIQVAGRGPEGLFSGSGHLKYYDDKGKTYTESLWSHSYSEHCCNVNLTEQPLKITKIEWWS